MKSAWDDRLLSELSAYADGELDAARAQALAAQLHDAGLQRQLALYKKLDEATAALPVPQLSDIKAAEAWKQIAPYTVELSPGERAAFAQLDQAAREMPVPQPGAAAFEQLWPRVLVRTIGAEKPGQATPLPAVSAERWNETWAQIEKRIGAQPDREEAVVRATFRPRHRWGWIAASVAALVALALLITNSMQPDETQVAMEVPEVLDERYQLQVEYVEGQEQPVITFLRTAEGPSEAWNWLPD